MDPALKMTRLVNAQKRRDVAEQERLLAIEQMRIAIIEEEQRQIHEKKEMLNLIDHMRKTVKNRD